MLGVKNQRNISIVPPGDGGLVSIRFRNKYGINHSINLYYDTEINSIVFQNEIGLHIHKKTAVDILNLTEGEVRSLDTYKRSALFKNNKINKISITYFMSLDDKSNLIFYDAVTWNCDTITYSHLVRYGINLGPYFELSLRARALLVDSVEEAS